MVMGALGMDWTAHENARPDAEAVDAVVGEFAAAWAQNTVRHATPAPLQKAAPAPVPKPVGYVTKAAFRQYQDGIEAALARFVGETVKTALVRMTWRTTEAERRIAALEERVAKWEGQSDE